MTIRKPLGTALAVAVGLASTAAVAQNRPFSPDLSCRTLDAMVATEGAVVIDTGPRTYDRFVHSSRFCEYSEVTEPAWIPAADKENCFVGYTCEENDRDRDR